MMQYGVLSNSPGTSMVDMIVALLAHPPQHPSPLASDCIRINSFSSRCFARLRANLAVIEATNILHAHSVMIVEYVCSDFLSTAYRHRSDPTDFVRKKSNI